MTEPPQHVPGAVIAVLGGGYAGLFAAHRPARAITKARHPGAAVVLIDSDDAWQERTRWHQVAAGETVRSYSRARIFRGTPVVTVTGTVTGIDLEDRKLTLSDREPLGFGRLVYAAGSRSNAASVPGAAAHAHTLDTAETSTRLAAAIAEHPGLAGVIFRVVVPGALIAVAGVLLPAVLGLSVAVVAVRRFGGRGALAHVHMVYSVSVASAI
jgi:NADH:ubiquinone reductase (H+-translocating)